LAEWVPLLLVIALATALRFWALGRIPPGLYHDEAFNGLDALGVLEGERPVFFEANNGREPLFIYLVALSVAVLGRSPGAIRIVAALLGTLTIPATYLMAKAMFNRRVGLLTAAVTGLTLWHVNLSRIGFRAVAMPLLVALALWQLWLGLKDGHRRHFLAGGLAYGLTFYTYLAARFTVVALAAFGLYLVGSWKLEVTGWRLEVGGWRRSALIFVLAALVVLVPLMVYVATHGGAFLGRVGQVSILNPAINGGDFWGTLVRHVGRTLLMFTHRGDFIPRHNVPLRPVFDPVLSVFFLLGLILCFVRFRQRTEHAFVLIWLAVMVWPTILAEDAPHFLRSVGILPVAFVVPAIGLDSLWRFLENRTTFKTQSSKLKAQIVVALALALGLGDTTVDYFGNHAVSQDLSYHFETAAVDLATQANRFLGSGWDGTGFGAGGNSPSPERHLYITDRLWQDWASVRFLVPPSPNLTILREDGKLPQIFSDLGSRRAKTARSRRHTETEVMLVLWPYEDYIQYLSLLPVGSTIAAQEGSLERGDLDEEARLLYVTYTATPVTIPSGESEARFEKGLTLAGHRLAAVSPQELQLSLLWGAEAEIEADYAVFVHLTRDDVILVQDDSFPAGGYYPTSLWRVGDIVRDEHTLALPEPYDPDKHELGIGFYQLETLHRLQVLDEAGEPVNDYVIIE
jgi:4-amino-4-deoxy-L-arabinose transferase-like glycosyltransferase